jgi:magnesium transporter
VPARQLILSAADARVADIMVRKVIALAAEASVLEACEFFIQHRLLAYPVVDDKRKLLGVVDVELYTDELDNLGSAEAREDLFQLIGVHVANAHQDSPLFAFRRRFPWLGCNLAAGILAAFLSGVYQDELSRVVALAFFIPVVLNLAESVSSQSVSLALQTLRGRPNWKALLARVRTEFLTGLLLGLGSGAVMAMVCLAWLGKFRVALCLLGGITGGVIGAAILGLTMPIVLRLLRLEPRVAAGPIALAGADVITILLYLNLARWLMH